MSTRCRHDIFGCKSRLQSGLNSWREARAQIEEVWNDATAQKFLREHFLDTDDTLLRMMGALQEAADLVRSFEKMVADDEEGR